jgi:hypothetical protein
VNADVISLDDIIRITRTQSAWSLTTHTDPLKKDHSLSNLRYLFLLIDLIFTNKVDVKKEGLIDRLLGDFSRPDVVEFIDKLRSGEILNGGIPFIPDSTLQIVKEGQSSVVRVVEDCQFEVGRAIDAIMSSTNSASEKQKSESCTIF